MTAKNAGGTGGMSGKKLQESTDHYGILSEEFSILLDAIPDRLLLLSPDMKVRWTNKAATAQLGGETRELVGNHCYKLWHGRSVPCDDCHAIRSFQSGRVEVSRPRTLDARWWDSRAFPVKDDCGRVRSVITVARDVTERVRMEEEAKLIQTKLIHTNKMASLGTLISGVAHEINNPNNLIMFNSQIISEVWQDAVNALEMTKKSGDGDFILGGLLYPEVKEVTAALISGIMESATRIKNIVDNLKDYSRSGTSDLEKPVDVNKVVSTSISILKGEIWKKTENFDCLLDPGLPSAKGNPQQLGQVVINLVTNALESLPDKKRGVKITTSVNGAQIVIQVRDQGVGMSGETINRIGEPFFTTKLNSGGTGLGLSICRSIIRDHKGSIEFASVPNGGTTATIRLPVCQFHQQE